MNEGTDTVHIGGGLTQDDIRTWVDSYGNLRIRFNGSADDEMSIYGTQNNGTDVGSRVERITFDDNTVWNLSLGLLLNDTDDGHTIYGSANDDIIKGNGGNDNINGFAGDDTITGGTGTNYLNGGQGNDSYIWNIGDGTHTISEEGGLDSIVFGAGISANDLRFVKDSQSLKIYVNGAHAFTIQSQYYNDQYGSGGEGYIVEQVVLANNATINLNQNMTFGGTEASDNIYGTGNNDTLQGYAGSDYLYAGNGNDTLIGGTGNDDLNGEAGNDTYVWGIGDGNDTLRESGGSDQIVFGAGVAEEDVRLFRDGMDLKIYVGGEVLTLKDQFYYDQYSSGDGYQIEKLVLADTTEIDLLDNLTLTGSETGESVQGTSQDDILYGMGGNDYLTAGGGNDTLVGGTGSDSLYGEAGDDTYVWNIGDGNDTIYEGNGADQIVLGEGIAAEDIRFVRSGTDLQIHIGSEFITVKDQFYYDQYGSGEQYQVEKLVLADTTEINLLGGLTFTGTASGDSLNATKNNDVLYGLDGNDYLYASEGNDTLVGGAGSDTLYGEAGNDAYIWNIGDGSDNIYEAGGSDELRFGAGIEAEDIRFFRNGTDLQIHTNGETITLKDQFYYDQYGSGDGYQVEKLVLDDTTEIDLLNNLTFTGTATGDSVSGTGNNDVLYGLDGNDYLYAGGGNDTLIGGAGTDTLYGEGGADVFLFEATTAFSNVDTIADFSTAQGDAINIADLLTGYDPLNDAITDFVSVRDNGSNTVLSVDRDGTGGAYAAQDIVTINGVTGLDVADMLLNNNLIAA